MTILGVIKTYQCLLLQTVNHEAFLCFVLVGVWAGEVYAPVSVLSAFCRAVKPLLASLRTARAATKTNVDKKYACDQDQKGYQRKRGCSKSVRVGERLLSLQA